MAANMEASMFSMFNMHVCAYVHACMCVHACAYVCALDTPHTPIPTPPPYTLPPSLQGVDTRNQ